MCFPGLDQCFADLRVLVGPISEKIAGTKGLEKHLPSLLLASGVPSALHSAWS